VTIEFELVWDAVLCVFVAVIVGYNGSRELAEFAELAKAADRVSSYRVQRLAMGPVLHPKRVMNKQPLFLDKSHTQGNPMQMAGQTYKPTM
jgi:hypothetical protein